MPSRPSPRTRATADRKPKTKSSSPPTTLLTRPSPALLTTPTVVLTTLLHGLKSVAKPIIAAVTRNSKTTNKSKMSQIMEDARLDTPEAIDEWQEVDQKEVKEEMRVDRVRVRRERERGGENGEDWRGHEDCEPEALVYTRRRRVRHWDSESDEEDEIIEIT